MASSTKEQLRVMLRKNWWLHKRMLCGTICESCCPACIVVFAAIYFGIISSQLYNMLILIAAFLSAFSSQVILNFPTEPLRSLGKTTAWESCAHNCVFAVAPSDNESVALGRTVYELLNSEEFNVEFQVFDSLKDIDQYNAENPDFLLSGVVFDTNYLNYTLRLPSSLLPAASSSNRIRNVHYSCLCFSRDYTLFVYRQC